MKVAVVFMALFAAALATPGSSAANPFEKRAVKCKGGPCNSYLQCCDGATCNIKTRICF
ncbi:hypothetical protein MAPG_11773 [Magnaporthiopsis poae ATCC 64411]|uniref:Uncharacterized protein n=1 Tax=Magnaporthiopsis poae (strain ATCC 64411 / 73-15) TaxID=644358 RepID=A0A0C4EG53_MAGP6|nr:hypothetical protein MAPG_11773 [Magnaporthiopsis poae ATCC 64411]